MRPSPEKVVRSSRAVAAAVEERERRVKDDKAAGGAGGGAGVKVGGAIKGDGGGKRGERGKEGSVEDGTAMGEAGGDVKHEVGVQMREGGGKEEGFKEQAVVDGSELVIGEEGQGGGEGVEGGGDEAKGVEEGEREVGEEREEERGEEEEAQVGEAERGQEEEEKAEKRDEGFVGFVTGVEGCLERFEEFVNRSRVLRFKGDKAIGAPSRAGSEASQDELFEGPKRRRLDLVEGAQLVFGGNVTDKGEADLSVLRMVMSLKRRFPDRVHLLVGPRDALKLRLTGELSSEAAGAEGGGVGARALREDCQSLQDWLAEVMVDPLLLGKRSHTSALCD